MLRCLVAVLSVIALVGCSASAPHNQRSSPPSSPQSTVESSSPQAQPPAHVVVVIEENHGYDQVIGNPHAPYINRLAHSGRLLTQMYAITHPSQPNYLALFSGSTHGLTDDSCPHSFPGPNVGTQLIEFHRTFVGYVQGLPHAGSTACSSGTYARKHAPWINFPDLPAGQTSRPFSAFPKDYASLPTVSFVIPNLDEDMHNPGTFSQSDTWLRTHLGAYASWARSHNSLLIVTWDEDDGSNNHIPTIIVGAGVTPGRDDHRATLYSLLRLIESEYGLPLLGGAASAPPISLR